MSDGRDTGEAKAWVGRSTPGESTDCCGHCNQSFSDSEDLVTITTALSQMGANNSSSKKSKQTTDKSRLSVIHDLSIEKLRVSIDERLTRIDESSSAVLKYSTPHFRAFASVDVPKLEAGDALQVGWIQACVNMQFTNTYGDQGISCWEFPEIETRKYVMISDSDGRNYPWYGCKTEVVTLRGPTDFEQTVSVYMNDNFFPQVTWHVPDKEQNKVAKLTDIYRKQRFYTWLVGKDLNRNIYHILKTIAWSMELRISVDPEKPLGQRSKLIGPTKQEDPRVLEKNVPIPAVALKAPNANSAQVLVWRPRKGKPSVVVPPVESTVDITKYLKLTEGMVTKILKLLPES